MSSPPSKRRRTSSPPPLAAAAAAGSPPLASSSSRRSPNRTRSGSPSDQRKQKRRSNPLRGFNDEEDEEDDAAHSSDDERMNGSRAGPSTSAVKAEPEEEQEEEEEHCAICLSPIENRAVVSPCHHGQFCWGCIRAWTDQSRKCPLCLGPIEHLIHNIRSAKDYQIHYLLPLHSVTGPADLVAAAGGSSTSHASRARPRSAYPTLPRHALYGRSRFSSSARVDERDETTWREREEERALERRRYIYREGLYAKHVASNRYTGFKPFSPQTFANNAELKAKVIKFIRRELQVFPAVDVAFLTTYLVSIASQLDLRSPSAIRLISDFLSEQDAQHLVHEISTFARSPFASLEGYDRFVQYGRPQREIPKEKELEELVMPSTLDAAGKDQPRFEEYMRRRAELEREQEREKGARGLPPPAFSGSMARDRASAAAARSPERAFPPRRRSPSPVPPPPRRYSAGAHHHQRRPLSPPREPDWRERDQRYTGSYYASSESRRDHHPRGYSGRGRGRGPPPPPPRRSEGSRGYYPPRGRSPSPPLFASRRPRSPSPGSVPYRQRRYSDNGPARQRSLSPPPSPPARSYRTGGRGRSPSSAKHRSDSRSPARSRSRSRSRSPDHHRDDNHSTAPARSRARSRSRTPSRRGSVTPSPPPPATASDPKVVDSELDDAISLVGPSFSVGPGSRESSPVPNANGRTDGIMEPSSASTRPPPSGNRSTARNDPHRPTLAIFGAARRILGNGRVVTLSKDGRASLQPQSDLSRKEGGSLASPQTRPISGARPRQQEPYVRAPPSRPSTVGGVQRSLLDRLGGIASPAASSASSAPASPKDAPEPSPASATSSSSKTADTLRAKLQARLTAEYRQALASRSNGSTPSSVGAVTTVGTKTHLRSMLQSRLQAEKALAYEDMVRSRAAASLASARNAAQAQQQQSYGLEGPTVFSQATRDLLMARLEEERLLADEEADHDAAAATAFYGTYEYDNGFDLSGDYPAAEVGDEVEATPIESDPPSSATKSESSLKAALLAKRQATIEDELKKRTGELKEKMMRQRLLMMQKRRSSGGAAGGAGGSAEVAE
ncbi:hypothetical protein JCM10908_005644 [Rhodotorula pacifica]|uniref:uncharacterized protein n=1 Tax=Rhodotorula pacifica TaxID=1495444 RepID=UPI00316F946D